MALLATHVVKRSGNIVHGKSLEHPVIKAAAVVAVVTQTKPVDRYTPISVSINLPTDSRLSSLNECRYSK